MYSRPAQRFIARYVGKRNHNRVGACIVWQGQLTPDYYWFDPDLNPVDVFLMDSKVPKDKTYAQCLDENKISEWNQDHWGPWKSVRELSERFQ
jgi:hypothetical protein